MRLRYRKSARKPSREIRIVVGAKSEVPFEKAVAVNAASCSAAGWERRYTKASRTKKNPVIEVYIQMLRHLLDRLACKPR